MDKVEPGHFFAATRVAFTGVVLLAAVLVDPPTTSAQSTADVRITNKYLRVVCLDGTAAAGAQRKWALPTREVSATFTMHNQPREGRPGSDAGFASLTFTLEPGHKYEIEVRAEPTSYSSRVWTKGEWRPVVRDRTTSTIVSGEPRWVSAPGC
jgi:hypothetical protein